jgi:hypothetical protein
MRKIRNGNDLHNIQTPFTDVVEFMLVVFGDRLRLLEWVKKCSQENSGLLGIISGDFDIGLLFFRELLPFLNERQGFHTTSHEYYVSYNQSTYAIKYGLSQVYNGNCSCKIESISERISTPIQIDYFSRQINIYEFFSKFEMALRPDSFMLITI